MNYVVYHLHTQLSVLDSCAKYTDYVEKAKECGMKALAFSEHGNIYEYYHKNREEIHNRKDVSAHNREADMGLAIRVLKFFS